MSADPVTAQNDLKSGVDRPESDRRTDDRWVSDVASLIVALTGGLVVLGWLLDIEFLKSVVPGLRVMVPNTAVCFILSGLALGLMQPTRLVSQWARLTARYAPLVVIILGLASLTEYLSDTRFGVERWIFPLRYDDGPFAGRMSTQTAMNFVLVGGALVLLRSRWRWAGVVADSLSATVLAISWLALVGFASDITRLYDVPQYPGLALHTAAAFFVLGGGLLFSHGHAMAGRLASTGASGALLRRYLPITLCLPVVLAWMRVTGERTDWYDRPVGVALLTIAFTLLLAAVVGANALSRDAMDRKRKQTEQALRIAHTTLEQRIAQRTVELASSNETLEREIGQRKQAQDELATLLARERLARRRAEEADRVKEEFLATVSHELRAPLNSILGWIHLIREGALGEREMDRAITVIERSARVQKQLVEDLLDASRTTSGKLHLSMHPVEVVSVMRSAIDAAGPTAATKSVTIATDFEADVGFVLGDPNRLQQVVWNLVSNAIKFAPAGGEVRVTARRVNAGVEVAVSDTGPGIEPDILPYIFDRFRQGDGSTTRTHGGLGLGLSIVRHLVELHGGSVRAESEGAGQGATFTVTVPSLAATSSPPDDDGGAGSSRNADTDVPLPIRLLMVDDDADSREVVSTILKRSGAQVEVVSNTTEATERLVEQGAKEPYDVLVCDVGMPEEDGYTFLRRVRSSANDRIRTTPAIALTGYAGPEDRIRAAAAGFQVLIPKPVDTSTLIDAIRTLTGQPIRRSQTGDKRGADL